MLNSGVSASGKLKKGCWQSVFQQRERGRNKFAGVSATGKVAANGVAAKERGKTKQVLDGVVSGMRMMGE
jgi:hypothetical protein